LKTETLVIVTSFGLMFFILFGIVAFASSSHHNSTTINNYYTQPAETNQVTEVTNHSITNSYLSGDALDRSIAMSAAGDTCVFDYAPGWQGCVGAGFYGSSQGYNGSLATRIDEFMLRTNLQTDDQLDDFSIGVGGSWHF
jgi:hypothetical protein